ncbi:MAG: methyltransferase domain-containing protein [Thermodesulfobacteriota bacterium]
MDWARQALGEDNKKRPEEIADLFEWKIRRLPSGRWVPVDKNDALTSEELFAKATARSIVGRHKEALALTEVLKGRQARFKDMGIIRSKYFLSVTDIHAAREALRQELRDFPDNAQAAAMLRKLDGDAQARQAPPRDEAFLDPKPSPGFADLYLVRKGILERLNQAIPLFAGTLLDVGCGQMPYRDHILAHNPKITRYVGLDFASGKYAERKKPDLTWDGRVIPLPDGGADCAMVTEVLEHCPDPLPVLTEIRRVLAPGGILFFTVPFLWPIHDAPHDHYRYTPYALERLLAEAGFEDARIQALGGGNAALAQMIGLWLRRAPMSGQAREQLTRDLFPFYEELARTDAVPTDFTKNPMITGLSGTAKAPLARRTVDPGTDGRRVVVVTDQFPVLSQTFILDQMTGLIDRGLTVEHWSLQRMDEPVVHENVGRYGLIEKTRYISLPPESLRGSPQKWTERFLRDNGIADLDDVAAVQVHFGPNFLKLEPLFTAHPELFTAVSFHGYDGSATFRVKGPDVYAGLFARADMITTPSGYMKDALARHGCPPDKIAVHHYGKDTTTFAPAPREKRSGPVRVLSVARFVEKKGLEYSLAAFATAQAGFDAQYRIVGYGPLEKELAALARTLGVADKVVFLGQLTNDAVRREMASADMFVLTSVTAANGDQEGVPVSLIEAQALGLPVVSSRHAGIPELVVHGETGFLAEERNVEEIAGYLRALIKNPAIRAAFSANARNRVLREFDLASLNDALAGYLLHRGAGRNPAAHPADQGHADETVSRDEPGPDAQDRARYCPICRGRQVRFRSFGNPPRPDALCPDCTSLERHRALWVFLERHTSLFSSPRLRMLHFAPEACLEKRFRQALGKGYLTADLLDPRADVRADITNLRFPDASFDAILCSHVLEHVPDDRAAMRELHRVLDADGVAVVMVPLKGETTEEDLSITDPDERTRRYGQSDHVRYYGMDIVDRLRDAGFTVTCIETADICAPKDIQRMRLGANRMFVCRKGGRRRTAGPAAASGDAPSGHAGREARARNLRATAQHWSASRTAPRTRWWMHPAILRHVNALVCGSPVEGPWAGLEQRMRELAGGNGFRRGLSVGCGSASKELHLLQEGLVGHFDLFEISQERAAAGEAEAGRLGVAERAVFHVRDAFGMELDDRYDLVYWNNALHHMFDVRQALVWSRERLRPGGWLVMDDYVGATRFQWPDAHLDIASRVRRSLPERLLRDPADPGRQCPQRVTRPTLHSMLAADPSEAADSDSILPALPQVFPGVRIIPTGGVVYNLALKDIIANFGDPDADRLRELLDYDAELAARGQTQYACAFASKQAA